jgi:N-acetylneuraminic acid mutarotase/glucose/arabinose dehydrogenase
MLNTLCRSFLVLASLLSMPTLAAAQATVYAPGCGGLFPAPTLTHSGSLTPGFGAAVHLSGAVPNTAVAMVVGNLNTNPDGTPLVIPLGGIDGFGPSCELNTNILTMPQLVVDGNGELDIFFHVPQFFGEKITFQFIAVEAFAPTLSLSMSEALELDLAVTVEPSQSLVDFGIQVIGQTSAPQIVTLTNDSNANFTLTDALIFDDDATDFVASWLSGPPPIVLPPGASTDIEVTFTPGAPGLRSTKLQIVHDSLLVGVSDPLILLSGMALGPPGMDLLVDCASTTIYMDSSFQLWAADYGGSGGAFLTVPNPVDGTLDDALYQTMRRGPTMSYAHALPNGTYEVQLHFNEPAATSAGQRVFDVTAEGVLALDDLDVWAEAGLAVAHQETILATVSDGVLNLDFTASAGAAVVSAIEARLMFAQLAITPVQSHDFSFVDQGSSDVLNLSFQNTGTSTLDVTSVDFTVNAGAGHDFQMDMGGSRYQGDENSVSLPATLTLLPGASTPVDVTFAPTEHGTNDVDLIINGNFPSQTVTLVGTGGVGGHPFLHVVIEPVPTAVDYDGSGSEDILLDGSFSHTHEPGHDLTAHTWKESLTTLASTDIASVSLPVGEHTICLTIEDDNLPPESLTACAFVNVVSAGFVPGVSAIYYDSSPASPSSIIDSLPASPDWVEILEILRVEPNPQVGTSPFSADVVAPRLADGVLDVAGDYIFAATGGVTTRLFVNGVPYTGAVTLPVGPAAIEARFAVDALGDLPLEVTMAPDGFSLLPVSPDILTHDESSDPPFINTMPLSGSTSGGNVILIQGAGFFPSGGVTVHWGADDLTLIDFTSISNNQITFNSPPHSAGFISVNVESPQGVSNSFSFEYTEAAPPPIAFDFDGVTSFWPDKPTAGAWGPDGRFYMGTRTGTLVAVTVDEDYNFVSKQIYTGVANLYNPEILGIAFSPFDAPNPVQVYVGHSELYADGGAPPVGPVPYPGEVSILTGPSFDTPQALITGLPTSNHDHGVNGMLFDNNGDLLIALGGNTNAGITSALLGGLPESPLSGAILKARTSEPGFNGTVVHLDSITNLPDTDQMNGETVDVAPGVDVIIQAPGLRNAFDMQLATNGFLYATDNGPNSGLGDGSSGPASSSGDAASANELMLIEHGVYYGHPNRSRGRTDARENIYRHTSVPSIPGEFRQMMQALNASTNGLAEYRATTFGGQMQGDLLVQRWKGYLKRVVLTADGRGTVSSEDIQPRTDSLGVAIGPGGAIMCVKYQGHQLDVLLPIDSGAVGVTAYDIFPWRAPATGGTDFVIGGQNFNTLAQTSVTIGGIPAALTAVTSKRIYGTIPPTGAPSTDLLDVVVTSGPEQSTISDAFRYLFVPAGNEPGMWHPEAPMGQSLGEVAAGIIDGSLYVVGSNRDDTLAYDIEAATWTTISSPVRPFAGDHHAAEVFDDKLFLFGGDQNGSEGRVQIYDPVLNSWSLGTDMPWPAVSCSTALIDGLIYVAGGIDGGLFTTTECGIYDPVLDSWAPMASMIDGRNHAAAGTDGEKMYIFGGRGPGSGDTNMVANGFADIQIYNPLLDSWESSSDWASTLAPMPFGRGGTGKAVHYQGEFYVFGGETLTGPGATPGGTYDRVDVYDPVANTWRLEALMPTARHGIFPLLHESRIFVAGGGSSSGSGHSTLLEVFTRQ